MFSPEDMKVQLTVKLLACGMDDANRRESVLALIPNEVKQGIIEGNTDFTAVLNIVQRCLEYEEGIEQLTYAVRLVIGETEKWSELDQFVQKLFPRVATYAERKGLLTIANAMEW